MRRLAVVAAVLVVAVVAFVPSGRLGGSSVRVAHGAGGVPIGATIKVRTLEDAKAIFSRASTRLNVGLTDSDIAATRSIYHFPSAVGSYAAGLDAYRAPLANGGNCIAFAAAVASARIPPNDAEPVMALVFDPDAERVGEPFVVIGTKAPDVRSITYTEGTPIRRPSPATS
jgi:hypothetical protein